MAYKVSCLIVSRPRIACCAVLHTGLWAAIVTRVSDPRDHFPKSEGTRHQFSVAPGLTPVG